MIGLWVCEGVVGWEWGRVCDVKVPYQAFITHIHII